MKLKYMQTQVVIKMMSINTNGDKLRKYENKG